MKNRIINFLRYVKFLKELSVLTIKDFHQYFNSSFYNSYNLSDLALQGRITLYYHAIEKGLSNENVRFKFGKYPLSKLNESLSIYIKKGYNLNNTRFNSGLDVIKEYIKFHKINGVEVENVVQNYELLKKNIKDLENNNMKYGGIVKYKKSELIDNKNFTSLVSTRRSVRAFSDEKVDDFKINDALLISQKSPSACNRQPWKTHVIKNKGIIEETLIIQKGFKGLGKNLDRLIVITSNHSMYGAATERNAAYIDGGLYAMTLLYALHDKGLATCTLNLSLNSSEEKKLRRLLKIENNEVFIMAIAVGNYLDSFNVPQSKRDDINETVKWY